MKLRLGVLALVVALVPATALAATAPRGAQARGIVYSFAGKLLAAPSGGTLSLSVEAGNHAALRALLGQSVNQVFTYDSSTEFLLWQAGAPKVVTAGDLHQGDWVRVNVRAPRGASLVDVERHAAGIVGDHVQEPSPPSQPLFFFRGKITGASSTSVSVDVRGGNDRAQRLLIGHGPAQTFTIGTQTIVLLWQGRVPTVISASSLKAGDSVVVSVRAARGSTLAQVEATAAAHVGEHEPAA